MAAHTDSIGPRLREAMALRRVGKMLGLACQLGVHESALSRWKHGGAMSLVNVVSVCEALDISMDWLVLGRGHPEAHKNGESSLVDQEVLGALVPYAGDAKAALTRFLTVARSDP